VHGRLYESSSSPSDTKVRDWLPVATQRDSCMCTCTASGCALRADAREPVHMHNRWRLLNVITAEGGRATVLG
jgi:hypothetical protein